jgi:hypothetical protein
MSIFHALSIALKELSMFTALALFCGRVIESVESVSRHEAIQAAKELRDTILGRAAPDAESYYSFAVRKPNGTLITTLADVRRRDDFRIQADPSRALCHPIA